LAHDYNGWDASLRDVPWVNCVVIRFVLTVLAVVAFFAVIATYEFDDLFVRGVQW